MFANPFNESNAVVTYSDSKLFCQKQQLALANGEVITLYEAKYMTPTFCNYGHVFG